MQRLLAVLLILIGVIGLVLGRLGETTWAPPTETTATVELSSPGPAVVIDPGVLYVGGQKGEVTIEGSSDVSLITADNSDIEAYLSDTAYTRITGASDWSTLSTEAVNPEGAGELSDPTGSDLWRTVETKPSPYTFEIADFAAEEHGDNQQAYRAILVVTDGTEAGADSVSITWPVENENEWVPFAYAGGAAIAVIGLVLLVVSIGGRRREDDQDAELEAADAGTVTDRAAADPEVEAGAAVDADADADADHDSDDMTSDEKTSDAVTSDSEAPDSPVRLFSDDTEVLAPVDGDGDGDDVADPDAGRRAPRGPEGDAWDLGEDRGTPDDRDDLDSEDRR